MELFGYEFLDICVVVVAPLCRGNFVTILNAISQGAVLGRKGSGFSGTSDLDPDFTGVDFVFLFLCPFVFVQLLQHIVGCYHLIEAMFHML